MDADQLRQASSHESHHQGWCINALAKPIATQHHAVGSLDDRSSAHEGEHDEGPEVVESQTGARKEVLFGGLVEISTRVGVAGDEIVVEEPQVTEESGGQEIVEE